MKQKSIQVNVNQKETSNESVKQFENKTAFPKSQKLATNFK